MLITSCVGKINRLGVLGVFSDSRIDLNIPNLTSEPRAACSLPRFNDELPPRYDYSHSPPAARRFS